MKRVITNLFLLIIQVWLLFSCKPTAEIVSKSYENNNVEFSRVFITMKGMEDSKMFYLKLKDLLKMDLNKRGIDLEGYVLDPLSLGADSSHIKMINFYKPDILFDINQYESRESYRKISPSGGSFDIVIRESKNRSLVWKAIFTVDVFTNLEAGAELSCKKIIKHLEKDGLIKRLNN